MTREERLEKALRRALAEADYICTGPIPHGDCWACAAHDALAAPSPAAEAGEREARYTGAMGCRCDAPECLNEREVAKRWCAVHRNFDPTRDYCSCGAPAAPPPAAAPATCGVADEGWEQFPCTKPKGHTGEHGWTGHVSLKSLRVDTAVPPQPEATACPECGGMKVLRMVNMADEPILRACPACGGTGRAPAGGGAR